RDAQALGDDSVHSRAARLRTEAAVLNRRCRTAMRRHRARRSACWEHLLQPALARLEPPHTVWTGPPAATQPRAPAFVPRAVSICVVSPAAGSRGAAARNGRQVLARTRV